MSKRFLHYLGKPQFTDWVVAIATIVIAFATWQTWREVQSGSAQTDRIVTASQKIQSALELSNTQNQAALTQTLAQSQHAMEASNKQSKAALDATIRNSWLDERPWVGLQGFTCEGCSAKDTVITIGKLSGLITNTGKTPALKLNLQTVWTWRYSRDPIPTWDSIEQERLNSPLYRSHPEFQQELNRLQVLAPNAVQTITLAEGTVGVPPTKDTPTIEFFKRIVVVGNITYYDTRGTQKHTTKFCLVTTGPSFQYCPNGENSMD
jgi:hypothetical protein